MRLNLPLLALFCILLPINILAQQKTITGKVSDKQDGSPLIGVSVAAKGSGSGTNTDTEGNFRIAVPNDTKFLVFTYIGYTRLEADIEGKSTITITLTGESKSLNEVVVVGYGTQKRKDVTGSVTTVRSGDFNKGVYNDPNQLIQGKTPGVVITKPGGDPNGGTTVRLRGINSLTGSNTPLYVIDGIVGADLATIPANEIESFDILKDAATASIYGARAANGVIIVTTKRGRAGQSQIEYNGSASVDRAANYLKLTSVGDIQNFQRSVGVDNYTGFGGNTDWYRAILRSAYSQNHTLSMSGGAEKTTYRASVNYLKKDGIVLNNGLERLTGRLNVNQKGLNDRLNVGLDLTANQDYNNYIGAGNGAIFNNTVNNDPSQPIRNADGSYNNFFGYDNANTVSLLNDLVSTNRWNVLRGSLSGNYKIIEGLLASVVTTYESKNNNSGFFAPSYSITGISNGGAGQASRNYTQDRSKQLEAYINYTPKLGPDHSLDITAGYAYNYYQSEGYGAFGQRFVSDLIGYDDLGASEDVGGENERRSISSFRNSYALGRLLSRANYNYKGRYYLTAGFVREGSSRFGSNYRYGNFPSASVAWRLSSEPFIHKGEWLEDLKLKASYGLTGNLPPDNQNLVYLPTYASAGNGYINGRFLPTYAPARNPNPNLRWETLKALNVGFDYSLFKGRFSGSIEYYYNKTENMLYNYSVPVPPNVFPTTYANVGSMRNRGIDFQFSGAFVRTKDFSYSADIVASVTRNKVLSISNADFTIANGYIETAYVDGDGQPGVSQRIEPGHSIGSWYMLEYAGLTPEGRYLFYNQNGEAVTTENINQNTDRRYLNKVSTPPYQLGLNNSFRYKSFSLNVFFNGQFGQYLANASYWNIAKLSRLPTRPVPQDFIGRGITQTDTYLSSLWLENGSFMRLQNATLSYNFDVQKIASYIKNLRLGLSGDNLFIITKYKGLDPELPQDDLFGGAFGIDNRNYYPKTRTITLNVQVTF